MAREIDLQAGIQDDMAGVGLAEVNYFDICFTLLPDRRVAGPAISPKQCITSWLAGPLAG